MRLFKAIERANALRPNTIEDEQKAAWIYELEGKLAETRRAPPPSRLWPDDQTLAFPPPCDNVYELYLCAMIDYANEETELYQNDIAVFNAAYSEAIAWWRRRHPPGPPGLRQTWKTM